jgi:hypothetical protein
MKVSSEEMMSRANNVLLSYNQNVLIVNWSGKEIQFNNGIVLKNNERYNFISRIFSKKTDLWKKHHDEIFLNPDIVQYIKSTLASLGGLKCQKDHGEKIKLNLNNGTPWNAGTVGLVKSWNKGLTKDIDERLMKISEDRKGENNPCYGKVYSSEEKIIKSLTMKEKILEGKFTPNSNNRNTHWESSFSGKKYRSSWEAWYQYLYPDSEFETLRIQYEINGVTKIYIVDFVDHLNKIIAEVKPVEMTKNDVFRAKWKSLLNWAEINEYQCILATKQWLIEQTTFIDYSLFDEQTSIKIKKIYETYKKD